jgi:hypothetical protein
MTPIIIFVHIYTKWGPNKYYPSLHGFYDTLGFIIENASFDETSDPYVI